MLINLLIFCGIGSILLSYHTHRRITDMTKKQEKLTKEIKQKATNLEVILYNGDLGINSTDTTKKEIQTK